MNVRVLKSLNRMNSNHKEDLYQEKMYSEWSSFCSQQNSRFLTSKSVLTKLPSESARQIVLLVVQPIAASIGTSIPAHSVIKLTSDQEINWCTEVIGYGLSLPLTEHDTIRDCVHIYCDWLSALLPQPKSTVPLPLLKLPNHFARKIIAQLYQLFVPRPGEAAPDTISRQALLCHRVLRTFQFVVIQSSVLEAETFDILLLFLLAINDSLLAPPTAPNDISESLSDRVLSVLFEIWIQACVKNFPTPRLWKTLTELTQTWRHRSCLIAQLNRINIALTSRLLQDIYGETLPAISVADDDKVIVPSELKGELLAQTWYRFFHVIGNPVQLAKPSIVGQTPKFLQHAIMSSQLADPLYHPCLNLLPTIFVDSMRGIATLIDIFLGLSPTPSAPVLARAEPRSSRVSQLGIDTHAHSLFSISAQYRGVNTRCNSLLHLFGSWLFEAALLDCDPQSLTKGNHGDGRLSSPLMTDRSRASSVSIASESSLPSNRPRSATAAAVEFSDPQSAAFPMEGYENGRAEAIGALCRIFCSKKLDENILPQYLARFYVVLYHGLKIKEDKVVGEATASILMNSADLLRINLDGVFTVLLPIVDALETVLTVKDVKIRPNINRVDLRRASIHVLISILAVPLHYHQLGIKELATGLGERNVNFSQLRPRLSQLLLSALQLETDPINTHLLLGGLASFIHDLAAFEQTDNMRATQPSPENILGPAQHDASSTIISSTSDTHSCHSASSNSYPSISEITLDSHQDHDASFIERSSFTGPALAFPLWSFNGVFNSALHLVSYKLLSAWKADLNTSLAAVEMLASLSKIRVTDHSSCESRRIIRVLCEYISLQCSRPPPAHSKDLHSTIVAAFTCCTQWLYSYPDLVADADCLHALLQVIELGISGSKSQGKGGDALHMKHSKDLKPVSLRVRDAAELLLTSLLEHVGNFPSVCGTHSRSLGLDENWIGHQFHPEKTRTHSELSSSPMKKFRYFATSEGAILGVLDEQPFGNNEDPQPVITLLLRNAFGKQAWHSELRHLPRSKCGTNLNNINPGRPLPMSEDGNESNQHAQYFPDSLDRVRPCLADKSIPHLDNQLIADDHVASELDKLGRMVDASATLNCFEAGRENNEDVECQPPKFCDKFQTARLFLSHLGYLSLDGAQNERPVKASSLIELNSTSSSFGEDLEALDRLGCRTHDVVHIFYVRSGQKNANEIVSNSMSAVDAYFLEFLQTLGWSSIFGNRQKEASFFPQTCHDSFLDYSYYNHGDVIGGILPSDHDERQCKEPSRTLYWADGLSEISFVVPTSNSLSRTSSQAGVETEEPDFVRRKSTVKQIYNSNNPELKMMIVWLESLEDLVHFPSADLVGAHVSESGNGSTGRGSEDNGSECFMIFIHAQQSGLYRIQLRGPQSKINLATPLVDGIVVSRRALGPLVRQTALNMAKRRRLDHESYQLPHVRRKLKISEMAARYRSPLEMPAFYTQLFVDRVI